MENVAVIAIIAGAVLVMSRVIEALVYEIRRRNNKKTPTQPDQGGNPHSDHDILIKLLERQGVMSEKLDDIITLLRNRLHGSP